jgi:hypothetical protein
MQADFVDLLQSRQLPILTRQPIADTVRSYKYECFLQERLVVANVVVGSFALAKRSYPNRNSRGMT